ncbi:MAG TPA: bifunctional riboflavin kinase/FAD synthetase [Casimicrobiaceae bacterium]|nr:bifunctional riboflavin kinase/FAD synthetase [Casimicrobiaceae bacterium]
MQVFRGLPDSADRHRPIALTIGNFDGVHRGHQAMLARLSEAAEDLALPSAVLTFDPHPREFFAPGAAPPRLSTLRSKLEQFAAHGIAEVHVARFDAALAALPAERFIDDVLVRRLATRWVLVGDDFRFGRGRSGDLALLRQAATTFSVEAMSTVVVDGERASSTAIRGALAAGELDHAARLLGRPYAIAGKVVHGDKLGRSLGFPTANIVLRHPPPLTGIFAVRVHGLGGAAKAGAASLGVRPTVKAGAKPLLEVFVFDFDEAVYGRRVVVEFLCKLRDEERYADLDTLTRQIRADVEQAREYFATGSSTAR